MELVLTAQIISLAINQNNTIDKNKKQNHKRYKNYRAIFVFNIRKFPHIIQCNFFTFLDSPNAHFYIADEKD